MDGSVLLARDRVAVRRDVNVECEVVRLRDFRLLGRVGRDVSLEGMRVASEDLVELGDELVVALRIPGCTSWVDAEAAVVRVARGRRRTDRGRSFGLRFARMDTVDRVLLGARLGGLPPPVPARHVRRDYARTVAAIAAR